MKTLGIVACLLLTGCYSSQITGDAGTPDTEVDVGLDTAADVGVDTSTDVIPDTVVDPPVDTGGLECLPPDPEGTSVGFSLDGEEWSMDEMDIDTPCVVDAMVIEEMGHTIVDLSCGTGGIITLHRLEIWVNPPSYMTFWEGEEVMFRYINDPIWWVNRWFSLRDMYGNLLFAGVDADRVAPEYGISDFYSPLQVNVVGGFCPPEPADWCGEVERQALDVTYWDAHGVVMDSTSAYIGELVTAHVVVDEATQYLDMDCDDIPGAFYTALFVLPPEG